MSPPAPTAPGWVPQDREYRRITVALFLAGLATFALVALCGLGAAASLLAAQRAHR